MRRVFGAELPPFSSTKRIFGHTLGAAGVFFTVRNRGRKLAAAQNKENP